MTTVDVQTQHTPSEPRKEEVIKDVAAGGSLIEALAGIGAVALAILGLAGILPLTFAAICAIALGAALLFEGGSIATLMGRLYAHESVEIDPDMASGLGAESVAGLGALVLGILALLNVEVATLLPTATIVLGAGMLFGSAATWRVDSMRERGFATTDRVTLLAREALHAAAGAHAFVGLSAVILGILALIGDAPITLVLVGMLVLGGAVLLTSAAIGGRFLRGGSRRHLLHHRA
jgi:hypothetical protein